MTTGFLEVGQGKTLLVRDQGGDFSDFDLSGDAAVTIAESARIELVGASTATLAGTADVIGDTGNEMALTAGTILTVTGSDRIDFFANLGVAGTSTATSYLYLNGTGALHLGTYGDIGIGVYGALIFGSTENITSNASNANENVWCVAYSPDGKTLASGGYDNLIRFWGPRTGAERRQLAGHGHGVLCIAFSPDCRVLASGSQDHDVRLWDVSTGKEVRRLRGHTQQVHGVAFSPDGKALASCGSGYTVRVWDVATGKEKQCLGGPFPPGHSSRYLHSVAFSPDGKYLAAGGTERVLHLWETSTWKPVRTLAGHTDLIVAIAFSRTASGWPRGASTRPSASGTWRPARRWPGWRGTPVRSPPWRFPRTARP